MVGRESSVIARRQLAAELRRLRQSAGRTLEDVAGTLGCTAGKISRIETGRVRAQPQDVSRLLDVYGIPADRRPALLALVHESRKREWWRSYIDVVPPAAAELYSLEAASTGILDYNCALIPGLLQTEQYARAIIGSPEGERSKIVNRRIELRMRRQGLLATNNPPTCTFLIDEAALRTSVGDHRVKAGQLERLLEVGAQSNVTIRIVPSVVHPATGTSFTIFHFAPLEHESIIFIETLTRNIFIDDANEASFYAEIFTAIERVSLSPEDSRKRLEGSVW